MADSFIKLSGSTDGKPIKVTATAIGSGVTIHTAGASGIDLVTLFAYNINSSGVVRTLTLGWGGTSGDETFTLPVPAGAGPVFVTDRFPIGNSLVIKASADVANEVYILGSPVVRSV